MALIDKASLLMVPSTYEAGKLYNVLPSGNRAPDSTDQNSGYDQTRADFDFDRGSNTAATRIGSDGLIKKYRENLLVQSNQFDTTWGNNSSSETSGQADKDGGTDAWLLNSTGSFGSITQSFTAISGVSTLSIYAKAGTNNWLLLRMNATTDARAWFDLENGVLGSTDGPTIESKIEAVGTDGWYRCSITGNTSSFSQVLIYPTNANLVVGAAGSIYIQNAQVESGLVSTDYLESTSVTGKAGVLVDLPRINFDANGENGSLLLEPSRQQLFQYSEWFDNSYWARQGTGGGNAPIVTQNHAISPEGFKNASRVQFDTNGSTSTHRSGLVRDFAFTTGDKYAISCYVKSASGSDEIFTFRIAGAQVGGEKTATNEWQLFTETHTATATTTDNFGIQIRGNYSSQTSDILIYGMQLESGVTYASSYIPNHGESGGVTRAADYMSTTPTDLLGSTTGSWFMELDDMTFEVTGTSVPTIYLGDDTQNCLALEGRNSGNNKVIYLVKEEGGAVTTLHAFTISGKTKFCFVWSGTTLKVFRDGTEEYSSTSFTQPTNWDLFVFNHSGRQAFSKIANIQLYDTALSDSEAQTLTTL